MPISKKKYIYIIDLNYHCVFVGARQQTRNCSDSTARGQSLTETFFFLLIDTPLNDIYRPSEMYHCSNYLQRAHSWWNPTWMKSPGRILQRQACQTCRRPNISGLSLVWPLAKEDCRYTERVRHKPDPMLMHSFGEMFHGVIAFNSVFSVDFNGHL